MRLKHEIDWKRMRSNMATIYHLNRSIWMRKSITCELSRDHPDIVCKTKHTSTTTTFWLFFSRFFYIFRSRTKKPLKCRTKCCYGLSMDLLDNVATELGFEFHLYVVRDQLFGAKKSRTVHDYLANGEQTVNQQQQPPPPPQHQQSSTDYKSRPTDGRHEINYGDTDNREYTVNRFILWCKTEVDPLRPWPRPCASKCICFASRFHIQNVFFVCDKSNSNYPPNDTTQSWLNATFAELLDEIRTHLPIAILSPSVHIHSLGVLAYASFYSEVWPNKCSNINIINTAKPNNKKRGKPTPMAIIYSRNGQKWVSASEMRREAASIHPFKSSFENSSKHQCSSFIVPFRQ